MRHRFGVWPSGPDPVEPGSGQKVRSDELGVVSVEERAHRLQITARGRMDRLDQPVRLRSHHEEIACDPAAPFQYVWGVPRGTKTAPPASTPSSSAPTRKPREPSRTYHASSSSRWRWSGATGRDGSTRPRPSTPRGRTSRRVPRAPLRRDAPRSPEEAREAAVLEDAAVRLAVGAVGDRVLLEVDPPERGAAASAGLAEAAVDEVDVPRRPSRAREARARGSDPPRSRSRAGRSRHRRAASRSRTARVVPARGSRSRVPCRCRRARAGLGAEGGAGAARGRGSRRSAFRDSAERVRAEMGELRIERRPASAATRLRASSCPASVRTSSPPSAKRSRNIGVFGPFAPAAR